MKKSLTLITTAAVALTMLSSTAMANTTKTTSDYKDLTNVEAGLKTKLDTLLAKGIFEGVSEDSFGISQNMTRAQFAKVASLVFGLKVDATIQTSSFTDVHSDDPANGWAIPYIEAAKKAGLIDGMTDTTFAPGENVTVGQLDTVFLKGLGKTVNTTGTPWFADAVNQAKDANIHPADKAGDAVATRADLVVGAYGSLPTSPSVENKQVSIASVQASGDQVVKVTLDKAVDTSKATLTLSKEGSVISTNTTWSTDNNSATLTLTGDVKMTNGSYTVTLGGLDSSSVKTATGTFTAGTSSTTSNYTYFTPESYELTSVIDSGLTNSATGTNGSATKADAEDPTLSKFAKEVEITVTNSSGEEVSTPGLIQTITSSNPNVVKVAVSSDHKGYILGDKVGTATISVTYTTISGDVKQISIPVNVKNEAFTAQSVEARDTSITAYATVTNGVYSSQFNAFEEMDLKVTDNYGTEYEQNEIAKYNFALNTYFITEDISGDPANGPVGTVAIDKSGNVQITGNVTKFTLIFSSFNDKRAYADVTVRKQ
ncbi:S-layer homology domain-containing protein [Paenibacillus sp. UNC451MF]|uniref:S-layer homology domain-containing protein n=1 Tax=Paenibacillus sp. UNC451MF TaxID=1449063 RepID=UPI00048A58CA|nr:S-layer homology domain-containing protein [Paenibacillus sp. UNC451MF]